MKVLILHQHFKTPDTGGAIRSYYLAKALVDQGFEVVVITARKASRYEVENVEGIEVHYLPIAYHNSFGFYKRIIAFMRFTRGAMRLSARFKDADVCYAISVPLTVGIVARKITARYKIPYIFEVGDLWPDAPVQMGFIRNGLIKRYVYRLEKSIYRSARAIVALSPSIQSSIEGKVPGKKIHLLPNISDTAFFKLEKKDPTLEARFGVKDKFVISYIGAIGFANGLEHFLKCAYEIQRASLPIHFLLCGEGAMLHSMQQLSAQYKLANLTFIPFQNRNGVREVMNVTDAAYISYKPVPILETGSPNKYFDGLAAGKLIIVNFEGWIKEEIEKEHCGVYISPQSPVDIIKRIKPFLENSGMLCQYQQAARLLAEKKYSRTILSRYFAYIITQKV